MSHISRKIPILACLAALLMLASSCARPQYEYVDNKDVVVENITHKKDGDFIIVQAELRNDDDDDVNDSVYRVEFYDADGMLTERTAWRPVKVKGGAAVHVRERSTVPGATEFTFVISNDARKP